MIPDYQSVMLPLLHYLHDGRERPVAEAVNAIADEFQLSPEERLTLLPSGTSTVIGSRVGWARTYLKKAGLLDSPRRGFVQLSKRGAKVLRSKPKRVDVKFLEQFPEFMEFRALRHNDKTPAASGNDESATPEEALEEAYARFRASLESELLQRVKSASPNFFERLVVELLVKMGYGGSIRDAGQAVGRSGDGGIDGIIKEDRLGLDFIYIQAKRWENSVSRPEIQKFAGALQAHRARKGVVITTSSFTKEALDFVSRIDSKVVLVDGVRLAKLMADHGVGVSPVTAYEIKKIDMDYFVDD
ncbi:MAG TPA: restriction endonuclease [Chthoniobacteraceae bacterium]|nr:restriction endonuclease [Chthoniobacteraceae bacterium]